MSRSEEENQLSLDDVVSYGCVTNIKINIVKTSPKLPYSFRDSSNIDLCTKDNKKGVGDLKVYNSGLQVRGNNGVGEGVSGDHAKGQWGSVQNR